MYDTTAFSFMVCRLYFYFDSQLAVVQYHIRNIIHEIYDLFYSSNSFDDLQSACENKNWYEVVRLVYSGAPVNDDRKTNNSTLLFLAARNGADLTVVKTLVEAGCVITAGALKAVRTTQTTDKHWSVPCD